MVTTTAHRARAASNPPGNSIKCEQIQNQPIVDAYNALSVDPSARAVQGFEVLVKAIGDGMGRAQYRQPAADPVAHPIDGEWANFDAQAAQDGRQWESHNLAWDVRQLCANIAQELDGRGLVKHALIIRFLGEITETATPNINC